MFKKINKEELEFTSGFWIFLTFQEGVIPSCCQRVGCQFLCQPLERGSKVLVGFLEEKLKMSMYVRFGLLYTSSDQIQSCSI